MKNFTDSSSYPTTEAELSPPLEAGLVITSSAIQKMRELILEVKDPNISLRLFIEGGGCSGFQYGFDYEDEKKENDYVIEKEGIKILVDAVTFQYLVGSQVDYKEDASGQQFIIQNPNAKTTCSCGSSFSV